MPARNFINHGECSCGAVAFEVDAELNDVIICHCSICRRATAGFGIGVAICAVSDFHWLRGESHIETWRKPGADWQKWFCKTCGSTLPGRNDDSQVFVPLSLLKGDDSSRSVAHHIWVSSKAPWHDIGDDGHQHSSAFGD